MTEAFPETCDVLMGVPGTGSDSEPTFTGVVTSSGWRPGAGAMDAVLEPIEIPTAESQELGLLSTASSGRASWRGKSTLKSNRSSCSEKKGGSTTSEDFKKKRSSRMSTFISGSRWGKQDLQPQRSSSSVPRPRNYTNSNMPQDYKWLESVLESIARNQAGTLGCKDVSNGKGFVPVFFVLGACPNLFCGMQAVMYSVGDDGDVDFWWVKPGKSDTAGGHVGVELNTLCLHAKGPYKNDPGRSKPFYKPLADLFVQEQVVEGVRFGIEKAESGAPSRAFLEQASGGQSTRQYMHLVWQEDWSSNPFSRSKYIKGKIVYQKDPEALKFYARQYAITNGAITVSSEEEPPFCSVLPGEDIKDLRAD